MKNICRGLSVAIFLLGAVTFLEAHREASGFQAPIDVSDTEPARSSTVRYADSQVASDGTVTITGDSTRYEKANGEWRLETERHKGREVLSKRSNPVAVYGGTPEGVYQKQTSSGTRRYVSKSPDQTIVQLFRSHNYLRNHPEFVRIDEVAGLKVYVHRTEIGDASNPVQWKETSYCPKTGLNALRTVIHFRDGAEIRQEAVSVEFQDVPEDLNTDLKNLPIAPKEKKIQ